MLGFSTIVYRRYRTDRKKVWLVIHWRGDFSDALANRVVVIGLSQLQQKTQHDERDQDGDGRIDEIEHNI